MRKAICLEPLFKEKKEKDTGPKPLLYAVVVPVVVVPTSTL